MQNMLIDIREHKNNVYSDWCGSTSKKCSSTALIACGTISPFAWFAGWYTKYFCLTATGFIGTVIFLPTIGYGIFKSTNEYCHLGVYEEAALEWQHALLFAGDYGSIKNQTNTPLLPTALSME
jgi:hypothetical protein